jgi:hypothetical protein
MVKLALPRSGHGPAWRSPSKELIVSTRRALFVYVLLTGMSVAARSQSAAPPPTGTWRGPAGAFLAVEGNGSYVYRFTAAQISGHWEWQATSPVGGILTLQYATPTVTQTFRNQMYLNIGWANTDTITVFGDVFHRM